MPEFNSFDDAAGAGGVPSANDQPDTPDSLLPPARESYDLSQTVDRLVADQDAFLAACKSRQMPGEAATAAFTAAIRERARPSAITVQPRRDGTRDLYFVHGTLPDGVVQITEMAYDGRYSLGVNAGRISRRMLQADDMGNGSTWRPSPQGGSWLPPGADIPGGEGGFYLEYYRIDPDHTGNFGDERDQPLAMSFRHANDQLTQMPPAAEAA